MRCDCGIKLFLVMPHLWKLKVLLADLDVLIHSVKTITKLWFNVVSDEIVLILE